MFKFNRSTGQLLLWKDELLEKEDFKVVLGKSKDEFLVSILVIKLINNGKCTKNNGQNPYLIFAHVSLLKLKIKDLFLGLNLYENLNLDIYEPPLVLIILYTRKVC